MRKCNVDPATVRITVGPRRPAPVTDIRQAAALRSARARSGLARETVALALGWPAERLKHLEIGVVAASLEELLGLSNLYAHNGADLLEGRKLPVTAIRPPRASV